MSSTIKAPLHIDTNDVCVGNTVQDNTWYMVPITTHNGEHICYQPVNLKKQLFESTQISWALTRLPRVSACGWRTTDETMSPLAIQLVFASRPNHTSCLLTFVLCMLRNRASGNINPSLPPELWIRVCEFVRSDMHCIDTFLRFQEKIIEKVYADQPPHVLQQRGYLPYMDSMLRPYTDNSWILFATLSKETTVFFQTKRGTKKFRIGRIDDIDIGDHVIPILWFDSIYFEKPTWRIRAVISRLLVTS